MRSQEYIAFLHFRTKKKICTKENKKRACSFNYSPKLSKRSTELLDFAKPDVLFCPDCLTVTLLCRITGVVSYGDALLIIPTFNAFSTFLNSCTLLFPHISLLVLQ